MGLTRDFAIYIIKLLACVRVWKLTMYHTLIYLSGCVCIFNAGEFLLLSVFPTSLEFIHIKFFRICANMKWLKYSREKKMCGLQFKDSPSSSGYDHKTGLSAEGQTLPYTAFQIPFYCSCKNVFLHLDIQLYSPYSYRLKLFERVVSSL
jgi:hypothetical protein